MRYGLAVVSPDFPEIKRILQDEQCGMVYKAGDDEGFSLAVMKLVSDSTLRRTMGLNGKQAVLKKYNWEILEQRLLMAYADIMQ